MGRQGSMYSFIPLLSLLAVADAKDDVGGLRRLRRRRLVGGLPYGEQKEETRKEEGSRKKSFYDLSDLTEDEKLKMIKTAYSLTQYGDSVDWSAQRDKYVDAVRKSRSRSSNVGANDDAYEGKLDDTLGDEFYDTMIDGNGDAYDGESDDTMGGDVTLERNSESQSLGGNTKEKIVDGMDGAAATATESRPELRTSRRLQKNAIDGDVFGAYEYDKGVCPNAGSLGVPCAPNNLANLCNKYNEKRGSFRECLAACAPAFCCIHDAPRGANYLAPNCNADENCPQYNYCYIAWWKLHDTVGPALFLRVEQDDEFYDIGAEEIQEDSTGNQLFTQVLLHHFDDIDQVISDGTETVTEPDGSVNEEFNADRIFLDEVYW
eukprot:CAMPEP_0172545878 /NCGR_PEP_ID=MMETSP1067-20121228/15728_1 /TAXON_ID=265564 ORGANISM="Thalassiosira punctigera, Strain Tpunct2005C2" /NCGR_SAMPLE_ID=MMETSP1067 /ASSEMBLY_ACC=CAM_ASM_000444 /LENGTH=375 /DNA_ID=CAMNT_0013332709 /DNA_START=151 /DNA_END=1275 /DNA_ORIENTATION=-